MASCIAVCIQTQLGESLLHKKSRLPFDKRDLSSFLVFQLVQYETNWDGKLNRYWFATLLTRCVAFQCLYNTNCFFI